MRKSFERVEPKELVVTDAERPAVREAVNDRGLFTAGWFGVRGKYCSGWTFTIVYDQTNRLIFLLSHVLDCSEIDCRFSRR